MNSELDTYVAALREIADATKPPYYSKAQHAARRIATAALAQWGRRTTAATAAAAAPATEGGAR